MKHHIRKEKNCLNCGSVVTDRFCSHCGQENTEPKDSLGHLILHFVEDVTHYDSKLFLTLKDLLFRPGFLTKEYFAGKRMKYLNPIRMYFFISFVFFLVLFLAGNGNPAFQTGGDQVQSLRIAKQELADSLRKTAPDKNNGERDSVGAAIINRIVSSLDTSVSPGDRQDSIGFKFKDKATQFDIREQKFNSIEEYDSAQRKLPESKRDEGLSRWVSRKTISLQNRYGNRSGEVIGENFEHNIPKMMFVLLPLFAWFIYIFHNHKKFYYTQHAIFAIHLHSFAFLLFLFVNVLNWIIPSEIVRGILAMLSVGALLFYFVAALKNTYNQSTGKSIVKAISIGMLYSIALILGIVALAIISLLMA